MWQRQDIRLEMGAEIADRFSGECWGQDGNPQDDQFVFMLISLIENGLRGVKIERTWTGCSG